MSTAISYDSLVKTLRKKYEEDGENEFVVHKTKVWGQKIKFVVRKVSNLREEVRKLKKEMESEQDELERPIKKFGVVFGDDQVVFLVAKGTEVKTLKKDLNKVSPAFIKKYKKFLKNPGDLAVWDELFDRTDIIEEFYKLYIKARERILEKVEGIYDDLQKEEFADNLLMQLLIIWYLQEKGFLDGDAAYLINKFKEYRKLGFESYYDFLRGLFKVMMSEPNDEIYHVDDKFGRIVVTGPAPFLNGEFEEAKLPDDVFYVEGLTEDLKKMDPKKVKDVPVLNLFESRDWTEGNIDEFVLGAIFEKLMTAEDRKEKGAYYTPEPITEYICNNTIKPYLVDRINEKFDTNYEDLDEFFETDNEEDHYAFLFEELQNIKILDPAVGSGHFLETAINVLVEIYEKIFNKVKELDFSYDKFTILSADEKGELVKEPLVTIKDPEERRLKVKFHIIISRNLYGVDILPSAIRVAKARMFMSLAKHFNAQKGTHIRFPNVHFNLRVGNSLIGFTEVSAFEKAAEKQATLTDFFADDDGEPLNIELDKDLADYIKRMDNAINTKAYALFAEVRDHFGQKLTRERLEKVLRLRSDLIKILLVSLNTDYAVKLKGLIDEITRRFNLRLNKEFVKYLDDKGVKVIEKDLEKIGFFHWIMEFSEVFLEKGGFDIVVGNPPYVRQEKINHLVEGIDYKELLSHLYDPFDNTFDFSMFFLLRSLQLTKDKGYHSFIITNKWLRAKYGVKIRGFLSKSVIINEVLDFTGLKVFVGATVDTMLYVFKKRLPKEDSKLFYNNPKDLTNLKEGGYYVSQSNLNEEVWNFVDDKTVEIKEWIEKVGKPLKEWGVRIYFGIKTGFNDAFIIDTDTKNKILANCKTEEEKIRTEEFIRPVLRGRDIGRYYHEWAELWLILIPAGWTNANKGNKPAEEFFRETLPALYDWLKFVGDSKRGKGKGLYHRDDQGDYWWELRPCDYYSEFEKEMIMYPDISSRLSFSYGQNIFLNNTCYFISSQTKALVKYLLAILNSTLTDFYYKLISSQLGKEGVRSFTIYIENLPIYPIDLQNHQTAQTVEQLAEYLLFLNSTEEKRQKLKELIDFIDHKIVDSLVYELYFKEKFIEDSRKAIEEGKEPIYPQLEKGPFLINLVAKYLKPIDYDSYAKLAYSIEPLSDEEKQRMEEMKEEYLRIIKEVVEAIKADNEIMGLIERIKSHEWVRVIEGKVN